MLKQTNNHAQGLVYYLPPAAFKRLLASVGALAPAGSRLLFDFLHLATLAGERFHPGFETLMVSVWNKGEPFLSGVDERPEVGLGGQGGEGGRGARGVPH